MQTRVFLTGVSGYIGSVLANRLASEPYIEGITGTSRTTPKVTLHPKVKCIQMDIRSPNLASAMAGHDVVVHTACVVFWRASMPAAVRDDINLNGTRNVARAAAANQVRRFVHASSIAAYDPDLIRGKIGITEDFPLCKSDSRYFYNNNKAAAERILVEVLGAAGIPLTLFRLTNITGPCDVKVVESWRANAFMPLGRNPRMQFVHEDDAADAFLRAVRADLPGAYNVVPDDFLRMSDLYKILGVRFVPRVPLWLARLVAVARWRYLGGFSHPSWVGVHTGDAAASNARLRATGWAPRHGSADALRTAL